MKKLLFLALSVLLLSVEMQAQAFIKHEYFGRSKYRDKKNEASEGYKGSANVFSGGVNIPLSLKINENKRPTLWSIGVGGSYTSFDNKYFAEEDELLDEILNMQMALVHMRPIKDNLSILLSVGAGIYMPETRFSSIRGRHILGNGAGVLIWHLRPNLDLGGGLALNNTFGYPMLFPAMYLNWNLEGKFKLRASLIDGVDVTVGYSANKYFDLGLVANMNGQLALLEKNDKDMVFTHQYVVVGLQPKVNFNKHLSLSLTAGIQAMRSGYFKRRTMKEFFSDQDDDPYFKPSFYVSTGFNYNF